MPKSSKSNASTAATAQRAAEPAVLATFVRTGTKIKEISREEAYNMPKMSLIYDINRLDRLYYATFGDVRSVRRNTGLQGINTAADRNKLRNVLKNEADRLRDILIDRDRKDNNA